ncbi:hypothetical protein MAPG_01569 [Magnaporthiopsis poae ATCC 64411]|uniref:Uncharacterized protein n=1 Tax=Magnaporthiopsis poae (strain ATCC 64411 / 73-15) TaxID=644358 RepID=A0A0C4DP19_MAGP6|nr:hypothetical protein MAPG_01569 [Magnaporthiopsis poae ATCC 64411]
MVKALDTVHGLGLGRPAAYECDLPNKILAGTASGSLAVKIDEQDIGLSVAASGMLMKMVANDKEPLDLTDDRHMAIFFASMGKFMQEMADNADNSKYGFADPVGIEVQPYGTPYSLE